MAKIIEATAVISAKDMTGAALQSVIGKLNGVSKAGAAIGKTLGGAAGTMGKQIEEINRKLRSIDNFRTMSKGLDQASLKLKQTQQEASRLGAAMAAMERPTRSVEREYARATQAVERASQAFRQQGQAVRAARSALNEAGVPVNQIARQQAQLTHALNATTSAMQRQAHAARSGPWGGRAFSGSGVPLIPRNPSRVITPGASAAAAAAAAGDRDVGHAFAGGFLAHRAAQVGKASILAGAEYDYAVRRQRAFADLTAEEQAAILGPQARRIAIDTKFSNVDVVEAQTEVSRRLPAQLKKGAVIAPIIDQVKNYALATKGVDMNASAEAVTGFLMSAGKDISTAAKAEEEARRATNLLIRMQKIGGMSHEDIMPFVARGVSAGRIAGLSDETMGAMAVGMRRNNISGDQAGTALRTISSKLVAPTQKGLAALATAGIDYNTFTKMPGGLSVDALEGKFRQDFGKSFTPAIREKLSETLADPDVIGSRGAFTEAVTGAISELFPKNKKGKTSAIDLRNIAKKVGEFHKLSVESVNSEGLLQAIIERDPSLAILNAFATDKHGNKLGLVAKSFEQFMKDRSDLGNVAPGYGDHISKEITGGLGGAVERLTGSVENLILSMSKANESFLTISIDKLGNAIDAVSDMPKPLMQFSTALAATTAVLIAARAGLATGALLGIPGAAGAGATVGSLISGGARLVSGGLAGAGLGYMGYRFFDALTPKGPDGKPLPEGQKQFYGSALSGFAGDYERSMKAQKERERDPEAARGRAMMDLSARNQVEAVVKPDQITAKADVSGSAKVEIVLTPSPAFQGLINGAQTSAQMPLVGSGPGSTGRSMPEAAPPRTGGGGGGGGAM